VRSSSSISTSSCIYLFCSLHACYYSKQTTRMLVNSLDTKPCYLVESNIYSFSCPLHVSILPVMYGHAHVLPFDKYM
jgi:hypothetical protein